MCTSGSITTPLRHHSRPSIIIRHTTRTITHHTRRRVFTTVCRITIIRDIPDTRPVGGRFCCSELLLVSRFNLESGKGLNLNPETKSSSELFFFCFWIYYYRTMYQTIRNSIIVGIIFLGAVGYGAYRFGQGSVAPSDAGDVGKVPSATDSMADGTVPIVKVPLGGASDAKSLPTESVKKNKHMITIETNFGTISFETFDADAPKTVENFVTLAQKGFYDDVVFHRIIKGFMIQGGDPQGTGTGGPGYKFEDELNPRTPSYQAGYQKGVVAMANAGPNTNGSQFFIMLADTPLPHNYTIFGRVVSGQDVVDKIGFVKTGANDRPISPVVMKKVSVVAE